MEPPDPDPHQAPLPEKKTKKELTAKQRRDVVARLLWEQKGDNVTSKFRKGVLTAKAADFHVTHFTIRRVWARALDNFLNPSINQFHSEPLKIGNCGRPQKWNRDEVAEAVRHVPLCKRRTLCGLAHASGMKDIRLQSMV